MDNKLYELTPSQEVICLQTKYTLYKRVVNILFSATSEKELDLLNKMVSAYLDVAEINALNMHAMTMKEWVKELVPTYTIDKRESVVDTYIKAAAERVAEN